MSASEVRTAGCNRPNAHDTNTESLSIGQVPEMDKAAAALRAKLALLGYSLHELSGGGFLVSRWDRTQHLKDLHAVSAFLRQIGGAI